MVPEPDLGINRTEQFTHDRANIGADSPDWLAAYVPIMAPLRAPVGHLVGAEPPADATPAGPAATYVGTYDNAYFGPASVAETTEGLVLRLRPEGRTLPMLHWDGDSFVVYPVTENQPAGAVSLVDFTYAPTEPGMRLQVEHLNLEGLGVVQRQR